ncbi:Pikachurin-like Protein [Tribolium castaneum]|uniref:Pikachurin-like Protein n=1 Tax=Tribolium castaneum TaxID=7070 RepID=A0A139WFF8_TRICA|nr:Pikachurin-like Protein [Tribolium castaneum]
MEVFWGVLLGLAALHFPGCGGHDADDPNKLQFEAAFQGRCNRGSPCEQLCYDLHDGMYECDCKSGFILRADGYSCYEINSTVSPSTSDDLRSPIQEEEDVLYQKDAVFDALELISNVSTETSNLTSPSSTTQGPSLEQKLTEISGVPRATLPISTERPCPLDCGPGGGCVVRNSNEEPACLCPLGRGGDRCEQEMEIRSPRFTGSSWLAFPALRGAYKHVQVSLELRPEAYDGIFFLTGERDDMAGDFMALLLHQGFVEFRFDCGSGVGVVRSEETVLLNQWNHITLYRHRWDAWLQLNSGKHVQGRSKGLFSRITFREPFRVPCQHGGKCLTSEESAVCLCPLGFSGDLCEIRVDLQVPSFNGSSHLRYRGLGEEALTWLDFEITLKPTAPNGLVLYNGHRGDGFGDFMALYLRDGYMEFAYDLGTGAGFVTSQHRISLGEWHRVRVSRTGRLAILSVDNQLPSEVLSPGAFTQLSLPLNLYLGGVPNFGLVSPQVRVRAAFIGCVQMVRINGRTVPILAEALGGANVDNCPHPCIARPCGEDGECVPELDYFTCRCKPGYRDQLCARGPPAFRGTDSYLHYNEAFTLEALSSDPLDVNVRFKVASESGLLLWMNSGDGGFMSLGLEAGALVLRFTVRGEEVVVVHNSTTVHDNLWHRVKAVRDRSSAVLIVDNGPALTRQSVEIPPMSVSLGENEGLYVGGMPNASLLSFTRYKHGIKGCVADLVLNTDYRLQVINHSEVGHNVGECEV